MIEILNPLNWKSLQNRGFPMQQHGARELVISINPERTAKALFAIALGLTVLSGLVEWVLYLTGPSKLLKHLDRLFYVDMEGNVPTAFSGLLLFGAAVLLLLIAAAKKGESFFVHWCVLGAIFVFLALDELAQLHDSIVNFSRGAFNATGYLYNAWVIPYAVFTLIVFFSYIPFLLHLPPRFRRLTLAAGICFVIGAMGFEMVSGAIGFRALNANPGEVMPGAYLARVLLKHGEELLEMAGVTVFIYALLSYILCELPGIRLIAAGKREEWARGKRSHPETS